MGELLTNHHGVEVEAVESMEMAPGVNPRPGRVPEQELLTPETCLRWRRSCGTLSGIWLIDLGFSRQEDYIGERAARGGGRVGLTTWWRHPPPGRAGTW